MGRGLVVTGHVSHHGFLGGTTTNTINTTTTNILADYNDSTDSITSDATTSSATSSTTTDTTSRTNFAFGPNACATGTCNGVSSVRLRYAFSRATLASIGVINRGRAPTLFDRIRGRLVPTVLSGRTNNISDVANTAGSDHTIGRTVTSYITRTNNSHRT